MSEKRLLRLTGHGLEAGGFDKAVLAVGSTESHGEHLPHGTDTLVASHLAEAVAERVEGLLVLPALPYGMSAHYSMFPVAVSLSTETLMRVLREVFASLLGHGIDRLLIVNGHDGNIPAIEASTREFRTEHPEMRIAVLESWWVTAGELVPEGTFVEMERAKGVVPDLPVHVQVKWRFDELTPYAVTGDPTKATLEKGRLMRDALVDLLVDFIGEMDGKDWEITPAA